MVVSEDSDLLVFLQITEFTQNGAKSKKTDFCVRKRLAIGERKMASLV